ncbi:hypothetical protein CMQ_1998 [Grosmannia clavigera kw1407]|uniref:Uncharacterized protein n=1 Tax=Grosmannia clavigera (strain kw1407 / UAMH 11150) TaxID=655863 RepID=F0XMV3_GROCL|nr:uncharacterized protein CMQ_1998 [Grosmannia clavigera kw1407]EFX00917.1 hypothetical protein CMQ_1998 [Grosmannia clavigera kw1407]
MIVQQPHRCMLLHSVDDALLVDACCGDLISQNNSLATDMERTTAPEAALAMLIQEPSPSVIVDTDGDPTRLRRVWERVIDDLPYSQKALFVTGVEQLTVWYAESTTPQKTAVVCGLLDA